MTAFPEFLTDGIGFNDIVSAHTEFNVALTDGIGFNDVVADSVSFQFVGEDIGFDDSTQVNLGVALEDGIEFDDVAKVGHGVAVQDGIVFDDSVDALVITRFSDSLLDGIGFNDVVQVNLGVALEDGIAFDENVITNPTDGIGFSDQVVAGLGVALEDGISFDDTVGVGLGVGPVDGIGFNDTVAAQLAYGIAVTDGISFNDAVAVTMAYGVAITSGIAFGEGLTSLGFPKLVLPRMVTDIWSPGALRDMGRTGLLQLRATKLVGWSWEEEWGKLSVRNANEQSLAAFVREAWNRGLIFDTTHALIPGSGVAPNGLGTAGITVSGASQTGEELITAGWPNNTVNVSRAGDVIKIAADNAVYLVTADADSDGSGLATLFLSPELRRSPPAGGNIITTDVPFRATIIANAQSDFYRSPLFFEGMRVTMTEALT